ncbi:MAG: hypothetical protein Q7S68_00510 [Deltaproteobacteria bacterium]|nr:hypothetical protein [Deltaproteobacteria bacterium]
MGVESLEEKFANLSIPVRGLRAHFDQNDEKILLPAEMAEVGKDLEAALAASRREGDVDWLTGKELVAEVNDPQSPSFGRSAFQILTRAAAFETIFFKTDGRALPCPNQDLEDLSAPIKPLRDFHFEKQPLGVATLFATTEIKRKEELTSQLTKALQQARDDHDFDSLTGREVLGATQYSCSDTQPLESFWQAALASAWIRGLPTIPVARLNQAVANASMEQPELHNPSPVAPRPAPFAPVPNPWGYPTQTQPGLPTYAWPGYPTAPVAKEESDAVKFGADLVAGTRDLTLASGGFYLQRGVVAEYQMAFIPSVAHGSLINLELGEVKVLPKIANFPDQPIAPNEFRDKYSKIYVRAKKEAKAMWEADKKFSRELPTKITRTAVKRGFIRGEISPRRFLGWAGVVLGLGDFGLRLFRDDGKGLEGPLTDLGLDPSFVRVAMAGLNTLTIGATVLAGGFSSPLGIAMLGLAVAGLVAPSLETPDRSTDQTPLLATSAEYLGRPLHAGFHT